MMCVIRLSRVALCVALCMVLCVFAACGKKKTPVSENAGNGGNAGNEENAAGGFCKEVSFFNNLSGRAFCDRGMLQVKEGFLIFTEYETGISYPLCSNAYCEHEPYDPVKNPDPVCEATLADMLLACIYGDNVYVIQRTGMQEIRVQARNLKESGYRVVADLPYCLGYSTWANSAIRGDKAYLLLGEIRKEGEEGEINSYTSGDVYIFLVELDLKTGKYKTLFHMDDGGRRYEIARMVYGETGIYMEWTYVDAEFDMETLTGSMHEKWEKFYYVSYDGTERRELCKELAEKTIYHEGGKDEVRIAELGEQGLYPMFFGENTLHCYRYDNTVEQVYNQPAEQETWGYIGESGNYLLIAGIKQNQCYELRGVNLKTGEKLQKEWQGDFAFWSLRDGVFERDCSSGDEVCRELWEYEQIFAEDGKPFFTIR